MANAKTLHLVPQFHYDIEYLLAHDPYIEVSFENLLEAHRLFGLSGEFTFLVEQAYLLEQFFREYPSLLGDFRRVAAEERLEIASGTYAMADQNMPSGESLMRQMIAGREWCQAHLGVTPRVFNAGDCTGAPAQLPQMIRHCGYDYYVFMRAVDDPARKSELIWRGLDGSTVPTCWLPRGYGGWVPSIFTTCPPAAGHDTPLAESVAVVVDHALSDDVLLPHGGDFVHPSERTPAAIADWNAAHPDRRIVYSTYARALDAMAWDRAPTYEGEWNPDRTGTYSSRIAIKQANRECEALLATAEAVSLLARQRLGIPVEEDGLLRAWKLTFVNQFHDTLWGTVVDDAHKRSMVRAKRARMVAQRIIESRLQTILDAQADADDGRRAIVFNPLPWTRTVDVALPREGQVLGLDPAGNPDAAMERVLRVELPACGYRVIDCDGTASAASAVPPFRTTAVEAGGLGIETPHYDAALAPSGVIAALTRKSDGLEFVDSERPWFNAICLQTDRGDLWQYYEGPMGPGGYYDKAADLIDDPYPLEITLTRNGRRRYGSHLDTRGRAATVLEVAESSPDRLVVHTAGQLNAWWPNFREWRNSGFIVDYDQTITFHADTPRIDFRTRIEPQRGTWYRIRAAFFTDIRGGTITHEIPFGRFARPEGEFAAQNYMATYDDRKGVALLNRGLPGNNVTDGVMMLSLMRSVSMYAVAESDLGLERNARHVFHYAVLPFGGANELASMDIAREGLEFAMPPYVFERHPKRLPLTANGPVPARDSLVAIEPASVVCTAVYPAPGGVVLRLYESAGTSTEGTVHVRLAVQSAEETDAMLQGKSPLEIHDGVLRLVFRPFEIKTILLKT